MAYFHRRTLKREPQHQRGRPRFTAGFHGSRRTRPRAKTFRKRTPRHHCAVELHAGCGLTMRPSFFSLFQRSNYYHRASIDLETRSDSSNEARRERKEVERYIVAAIAFCLQHDREFRNRFFAATCSYKRDPPLGRWSIEVEPHAWGDLVIRNRTTSGHFVYAVECKVG